MAKSSSTPTGAGCSDVFEELPHVDDALIEHPAVDRFRTIGAARHAPRFLLLYGSLRARSYSRLLTMEAARLLQAMGGETRIFDPAGLPLPDDAPVTHAKVQELSELEHWDEAKLCCAPE